MEHAKKMILISPDTLSRLQQQSHNGEVTLNQIDKEMKTILDSKLAEHEKWARYQEVLQRYLYFQKQTREAIKIPITEESSPEVKAEAISSDHSIDNYDINNIVTLIPKTYRTKARSLLQKIKTNKIINWNENGVVSIENKEIPLSNITDLISDVVRSKKYSSPIGWREFGNVLRDSNIPNELIGNPRRRKLILGNELTTEKIKSSKRKLNFDSVNEVSPSEKKKILWENFSF